MSLSAAYMISLADDPSVGTYDDCSYHWVRFGILLTVPGQLDATSHISLVVCHIESSVCYLLQKYI